MRDQRSRREDDEVFFKFKHDVLPRLQLFLRRVTCTLAT